jgi:Fic family protein
LIKEGSTTPGVYRKTNAKITHSKHKPPDHSQVDRYMEELFRFIGRKDAEKYDLIKTAVAHHRFTWIHPFDNGNGRTVRLLTYAMLTKQGFQVSAGNQVGRILNPTAIFCNDRNRYYDALSWADAGTGEGILRWCEYVLHGLKQEIEKIDKLTDYGYLSEMILVPAISLARKRENITDLEERVLKIAVSHQVFKSSDIEHLMPGKVYTERSRVLRSLKDKNMIMPETNGARKYVLRFDNNYLLRSIIEVLGNNGFLPVSE